MSGQTSIPEAKLYYYKARVYDPNYGRFLQTDPIGSKDDLDLYAYTGDDPINGSDPSGLCFDNCPDFHDASTNKGMEVLGGIIARHPGETLEVIGQIVSAIPTPQTKVAGPVITEAGVAVTIAESKTGTAVPITSKSSTLLPGPYANESVPATSSGATPAERQAVTEVGNSSGCHTCGTKNPGTKTGNFVPDHQPPTAVNPPGGKQSLYPYCLSSSRRQGGEVRQQQQKPPQGTQSVVFVYFYGVEMKICAKISASHGLLFVADSFSKEDVPSDTSLANVTFTKTCIAFWVMHEVDGDVAIELTDEMIADAPPQIFSGLLKCESGSISLSQPDMTELARLKFSTKMALVNIYANDDVNPDRVIVQISPA